MHGPGPFHYEQVAAIFVMNEPNHFGQALQIATDFLLSSRPWEVELEPEQLPIVFVNEDLLWRAEFPFSRLGTGAFKIALQSVYRARLRAMGISADEIEQREHGRWHQIGKPRVSQYRYVERVAHHLLSKMTQDEEAGESLSEDDRCTPHLTSMMMVGDNHRTDILGATVANILTMRHKERSGGEGPNNMHWGSVLVKTGVWQSPQPTHGALAIENHAYDAVQWILHHRNDISAFLERRPSQPASPETMQLAAEDESEGGLVVETADLSSSA